MTIKLTIKYLGLTENAKLRELISDMWNDAVTRMNVVDRHEFIDKFLDRLRYLEVEV